MKLNELIPQLIQEDETEQEYEPMHAELHEKEDDDLAEIMLDGRLAYHDGQEEHANPYDEGTTGFEYWSDGWEDANEDYEQSSK